MLVAYAWRFIITMLGSLLVSHKLRHRRWPPIRDLERRRNFVTFITLVPVPPGLVLTLPTIPTRSIPITMKFHGVSVLLCAGLLGSATAWVAPSPLRRSVMNRSYARGPTALRMAIDYNDPVVAEEFNNVQPMTYEEVEAELSDKGIPVSATMNEMDVKLMLVEMRLRFAGKLGGKKKERPAKFTSKLEEALWTKPVFEEFYNDLKTKGDNNALNVVTEYVQNKDIATQRYGKDYKALLRKVEAALTAPPPVNSPTLTFSGCKCDCLRSHYNFGVRRQRPIF